jgi:pimeloyl-ACP methyl ester carboxylesterase
VKSSELPGSVDVPYAVNGTGDPILWAGGLNPVVYDIVSNRFPRTVQDRTVISTSYREPMDSNGVELQQTTEAYAADALRVLDRLGIEKVHLVGTGGMGAMVMMQVGIMDPDRVTAAALVQGTLKMDVRARWISASIEALRLNTDYAACQRLMLAICHTPDYLNEHAERLASQEWTALASAEKEKQHLAFISACATHDVTKTIHRMTAPSVVITGDATDPLMGSWAGEAIHAAMPNSEFVIVPGAPHAIWESRAILDQFDTAMADFLAKHPLDA